MPTRTTCGFPSSARCWSRRRRGSAPSTAGSRPIRSWTSRSLPPPGSRTRNAAAFPCGARRPRTWPAGPSDADCRIDETIDHSRIEFTTTCAGLPHIVAVAYYPNWRVQGATAVHLVSPSFMLVFPDGPRVTLTYRRIAIDWIGIGLTLLALTGCVAHRQRAPLQE